MQTFFGVTPLQASRSIFPQFNAGAGLEDVNGGLTLVYLLSDHWFLGADASATQYLDQAARSPITISNTNATVAAASATIFRVSRMAVSPTLLRMMISGAIPMAPGLAQARAPAPACLRQRRPSSALSVFQQEQAMSPAQRIKRWLPLVTKASHRAGVPVAWINAVMRVESGGRTMLGENQPMVSSKGAIGLMQVLPQTFEEMRAQYRLGSDPFDPKNNIPAGAAYLRWLRGKYGYPALFAAYNAGPERVDDLLAHGKALPAETQSYVIRVGAILGKVGGPDGTFIIAATFTRPDGSPVQIDPMAVSTVRAPLPGEYPPEVQSVLAVGKLTQGVREDASHVTAAIRARGGRV